MPTPTTTKSVGHPAGQPPHDKTYSTTTASHIDSKQHTGQLTAWRSISHIIHL